MDVVIAIFFLLAWAVHVAGAMALNYYENANDWAWIWWRLFLPPILFVAIALWWYAVEQYHTYALLVIYAIIAIILTAFNILCVIWTSVADWGQSHCHTTLWCGRFQYWTVDILTQAVILGPTVDEGPCLAYWLWWLGAVICIILSIILIVMSFVQFSITWYRDLALNNINQKTA